MGNFYTDDYERKALMLANEKGFHNFSFEEREDDYEDDYENFDDDGFYNLTLCGKKCQERKRQVEAGLSRKEARQNVRDMKKGKEARHDLPDGSKPTGVQDLSKRGAIGNAIAVTYLAIPRSAFLSLIMLNYRGNATKLNEAMTNPRYKTKWEQVKVKWARMGGAVSSLENAIKKGESKKPFFCGKKCQAKQLVSNVTGADDAAIGMWIGAGTTLLTTILTTLGSVSTPRDKEISDGEANSKKEDDGLTPGEREALDDYNAKNDPRKQIENNPNLTDAERKEALRLYDEAMDTGSKYKNLLIYGGIALLVIGIGIVIYKRNKK